MKVSDLQQFLRSLVHPLSVGAKKLSTDLEKACAGLTPFKDLSVEQFADFLVKAKTFDETGQLPVKPSRVKAAKTKPEPFNLGGVPGAAQLVRSLQERALDPDLQFSTIEQEIGKLDKGLGTNEMKQLASELGIEGKFKT